MGKLALFAVNFDRQNGVFYGGEVVTGTVLVNLIEEIKMREIRMDINGGSRVHWTEQHGTGKSRHTKHYGATEVYFATTVVLRKDAPDSFMLQPGNYSFPFQFLLSPQLPTSFESAVGHVRYFVKVTIDRPWAFDNTVKRPFTVLSHLDLNREPNILTPVGATEQRTLCCCCCKSGPISVALRLDRTGFVPGETIPIHAECNNSSNRRVKATRAMLMRTTSYHATTKTRRMTVAVATLQRGEVAPGGSDTWRGELLPIPPCPPSGLRGCQIIDIAYYVVISADPAGPAFDLEAIVPVTIGTIPLMQSMSGFNFPSPSSPFMAEYPSLPPPAYESCLDEKHNIRDEGDNEHTEGDPMFSPAYTYYNWTQPPAASAPNIQEARL